MAGDKAQARARFQTAAKVDPKSETAWLSLAKATDSVDEEIYALGQALALNPQNMEARNRRWAVQAGRLRKGSYASADAGRESAFRRIIHRAPILLAIIVFVLAAVVAGYYVINLVSERASAQGLRGAVPPPTSVAFPATWTPQPTIAPTLTPLASRTPFPAATAEFVTGQTSVGVNARSGPGTSFPVIGTLSQKTVVILVGVSHDGSFYQVHLPDDTKLVWISSQFVDVIGGNETTIPEVIVPTPRTVIRPSETPAPRSFSFSRSKAVNNPYPPQCNLWDLHGTVWTGVPDASQPTTGMLVRVWINGVTYKTDSSGSRGPTHVNPGYWEIDFPANQAVSGLVAMVNPDNWKLSPQYPFSLTADCGSPNSVNEMIIDFSPR